MRVTDFRRGEGDGVVVEVAETPSWRPFTEWDGQPLEQVELDEVGTVPGAEFQLIRIAAGGHFVMHSSPDVAFCQVVRGEGMLVMPEGRSLSYRGPELYIFHPHTLHEWRSVTADTLMSVCLIEQEQT